MGTKARLWPAVAAALLLGGCSAMTGLDTTARTEAPNNDRFARAWCEVELVDGSLGACASPRPPRVQYGDRCTCQAGLAVGRVVRRPDPNVETAASRAYIESASTATE